MNGHFVRGYKHEKHSENKASPLEVEWKTQKKKVPIKGT